jgi:broad specificity phosphatase PhoE
MSANSTNNITTTMVKIYVARHGQDADNANGILNGHRNEPLTDLGRQQAKDVATKMFGAGFRFVAAPTTSLSSTTSSSQTILSAIYTSPLQRALHTARIFADILKDETHDETNVEFIHSDNATSASAALILDDLIERDFGIMAGLPTSCIPAICGEDKILKTETINYFLDPEGAETFPQLIDRAKRLFNQIDELTKDLSSDASILLVTHGDFGKMLYAAFYDLSWEDVLRQFHFGNSEVLLLSKESSANKAHVFETQQFNS